MARIMIEEVFDHLDTNLRNALELTVRELYPEVFVDKHTLFRTFKRMVRRKCAAWENIPDNLVEK